MVETTRLDFPYCQTSMGAIEPKSRRSKEVFPGPGEQDIAQCATARRIACSQRMPMEFHKMHANGDDFVIVDARGRSIAMTSALACRLGNRHRGIGFNQLAMMSDGQDGHVELAFWNADGTPLDACGSATRGVAHLLMRETAQNFVFIRTKRGLLRCERRQGGTISVDMGTPSLDWRDVPLAREADTLALPLAGDPTACSMGNPHCTFFVDDLSRVDVPTVGPAMEMHPLFPQRTNVHFVEVLSRSHIRLRIWERGGGIPLGSGSCSCGAVVGGIRRGLLDERVVVVCDGGPVEVEWDGTGGVRLAGPVEHIYSGEIDRPMLDRAL
nr:MULTISPECIES: diaminopimelate epimerase [unclassified Novosphingobium]